MRIDVHQHLWSEPLVAALAARASAPCIRRDGQAWRLHLPSEASCLIDVAGDEPLHRATLLALDGVDGALIALSTALGAEGLPPDEGLVLLDAFAAGVAGLADDFGAWASVSLTDIDAGALDAALDAGAAGLCLPSAAVSSRFGLDRCGPLLERLERRGAPLFVHPGPDPWGAAVRSIERRPGWWPAMTDYVAGMNEAWHQFVAHGRRAHPQLRVVFAMLAGGGPLHLERLAARGGPIENVVDPGLFYDTSSYGARMIDAMVRVVGIDQLVHGSDRPVAAPFAPPGPLGEAAWRAMSEANPGRLLGARDMAVAA
jgi:predicted TIM-barrel fold metal-dependent hydrolase